MVEPEGLHVVEHAAPDASAPTVVVVHGAMDRAASFGRVARHLGDVTLVRYDRRGYARSAALGVGTLDDHVADLLAVVDGRPVTVFGHSIGGVIALVAAQRSPELVRSLLVYEAPSPWSPWWPSRSGRAVTDPAADDQIDRSPADEAEAFMRRAIGDRYWERLPARTRADRRSEGPALLADLASLRSGAPYDPRAIAAPTVVASGGETSGWHARAARELAVALANGELTTVAGAGHGVHLSHPTATAALVRQALARQ